MNSIRAGKINTFYHDGRLCIVELNMHFMLKKSFSQNQLCRTYLFVVVIIIVMKAALGLFARERNPTLRKQFSAKYENKSYY